MASSVLWLPLQARHLSSVHVNGTRRVSDFIPCTLLLRAPSRCVVPQFLPEFPSLRSPLLLSPKRREEGVKSGSRGVASTCDGRQAPCYQRRSQNRRRKEEILKRVGRKGGVGLGEAVESNLSKADTSYVSTLAVRRVNG